jgi:DNA polymerase/3'-5' exonuclease PolX
MSVTSEAFQKILQDLISSASGYRKVAFSKASKSLTESGLDYISIAQASKLPGFGKGILERFTEFVNTNQLSELKELNEKSHITTIFEGIYGVGPVLAGRWYDLGYRKLTDIPFDSLTSSQQIGMKYYDDINSTIPRNEIDKISSILDMIIKKFNTEQKCQIRYQICGSYLRGKPTSGDIDIVITEINGNIQKLIDPLLIHMTGFVEHVLAKGSAKVLCIGGLVSVLKQGKRRRIDFELIEPNEWPFATLYFTGSKNFNVHMRGIAKEKGYTLNHKGLFTDDLSIGVNDEKEIFDFLDMKYVTPMERDSW